MLSFLTHAACLLIGVAIGVFACALCVARAREPKDDSLKPSGKPEQDRAAK